MSYLGHFDAAILSPGNRQLLLHGIAQFLGVAGQSGVADAHGAESAKGGLQGGQELAAHLSLQLAAPDVEFIGHIACNAGVEDQGIGQAEAVLTEAADADVNVDAGPLIHHPEGDGWHRFS